MEFVVLANDDLKERDASVGQLLGDVNCKPCVYDLVTIINDKTIGAFCVVDELVKFHGVSLLLLGSRLSLCILYHTLLYLSRGFYCRLGVFVVVWGDWKSGTETSGSGDEVNFVWYLRIGGPG